MNKAGSASVLKNTLPRFASGHGAWGCGIHREWNPGQRPRERIAAKDRWSRFVVGGPSAQSVSNKEGLERHLVGLRSGFESDGSEVGATLELSHEQPKGLRYGAFPALPRSRAFNERGAKALVLRAKTINGAHSPLPAHDWNVIQCYTVDRFENVAPVLAKIAVRNIEGAAFAPWAIDRPEILVVVGATVYDADVAHSGLRRFGEGWRRLPKGCVLECDRQRVLGAVEQDPAENAVDVGSPSSAHNFAAVREKHSRSILRRALDRKPLALAHGTPREGAAAGPKCEVSSPPMSRQNISSAHVSGVAIP